MDRTEKEAVMTMMRCYTELPKLKNQTVGFRSFIKTSTYSKLTFEYHHLSEFRRGGNKLNRPPHEADIAEQLQHTINSGEQNLIISLRMRNSG